MHIFYDIAKNELFILSYSIFQTQPEEGDPAFRYMYQLEYARSKQFYALNDELPNNIQETALYIDNSKCVYVGEL